MQSVSEQILLSNSELGDWMSCLNDKEFAELVEYNNFEIHPQEQLQLQQQQVIIDDQGTVTQNIYPNWNDDSLSQPSIAPSDIFHVSQTIPDLYPYPTYPLTQPTPQPPQPQPQPRPRKQQSPQKRKRDNEEEEEEEDGDYEEEEEESTHTSTSPPPKKKYYKKKNVPLHSVIELPLSSEMILAITEYRGKYGKDLHSVPLVTFDDCSWRAALSRKKNCVIVRSAVKLPPLVLKVNHVSSLKYFDVCIVVGDVQYVQSEDGDHLYYLHFELKATVDFALKRAIEGARGKRGCAIPLYEVRFDVCSLNSGASFCSFTGGIKRRAN